MSYNPNINTNQVKPENLNQNCEGTLDSYPDQRIHYKQGGTIPGGYYNPGVAHPGTQEDFYSNDAQFAKPGFKGGVLGIGDFKGQGIVRGNLEGRDPVAVVTKGVAQEIEHLVTGKWDNEYVPRANFDKNIDDRNLADDYDPRMYEKGAEPRIYEKEASPKRSLKDKIVDKVAVMKTKMHTSKTDDIQTSKTDDVHTTDVHRTEVLHPQGEIIGEEPVQKRSLKEKIQENIYGIKAAFYGPKIFEHERKKELKREEKELKKEQKELQKEIKREENFHHEDQPGFRREHEIIDRPAFRREHDIIVGGAGFRHEHDPRIFDQERQQELKREEKELKMQDKHYHKEIKSEIKELKQQDKLHHKELKAEEKELKREEKAIKKEEKAIKKEEKAHLKEFKKEEKLHLKELKAEEKDMKTEHKAQEKEFKREEKDLKNLHKAEEKEFKMEEKEQKKELKREEELIKERPIYHRVEQYQPIYQNVQGDFADKRFDYGQQNMWAGDNRREFIDRPYGDDRRFEDKFENKFDNQFNDGRIHETEEDYFGKNTTFRTESKMQYFEHQPFARRPQREREFMDRGHPNPYADGPARY